MRRHLCLASLRLHLSRAVSVASPVADSPAVADLVPVLLVLALPEDNCNLNIKRIPVSFDGDFFFI